MLQTAARAQPEDGAIQRATAPARSESGPCLPRSHRPHRPKGRYAISSSCCGMHRDRTPGTRVRCRLRFDGRAVFRARHGDADRREHADCRRDGRLDLGSLARGARRTIRGACSDHGVGALARCSPRSHGRPARPARGLRGTIAFRSPHHRECNSTPACAAIDRSFRTRTRPELCTAMSAGPANSATDS